MRSAKEADEANEAIRVCYEALDKLPPGNVGPALSALIGTWARDADDKPRYLAALMLSAASLMGKGDEIEDWADQIMAAIDEIVEELAAKETDDEGKQ